MVTSISLDVYTLKDFGNKMKQLMGADNTTTDDPEDIKAFLKEFEEEPIYQDSPTISKLKRALKLKD